MIDIQLPYVVAIDTVPRAFFALAEDRDRFFGMMANAFPDSQITSLDETEPPVYPWDPGTDT